MDFVGDFNNGGIPFYGVRSMSSESTKNAEKHYAWNWPRGKYRYDYYLVSSCNSYNYADIQH